MRLRNAFVISVLPACVLITQTNTRAGGLHDAANLLWVTIPECVDMKKKVDLVSNLLLVTLADDVLEVLLRKRLHPRVHAMRASNNERSQRTSQGLCTAAVVHSPDIAK